MKKIFLIAQVFAVPCCFANECHLNEVLIASCDLQGKENRSAVICSNPTDGTSRYYFKKNGRVELSVKFNGSNKLKRWVDLGTYSTYLGFKIKDYSYVILIPEERPEAVALLKVKSNNRKVMEGKCKSNSFGEKQLKKKH